MEAVKKNIGGGRPTFVSHHLVSRVTQQILAVLTWVSLVKTVYIVEIDSHRY
jgi:hypothetical protein